MFEAFNQGHADLLFQYLGKMLFYFSNSRSQRRMTSPDAYPVADNHDFIR